MLLRHPHLQFTHHLPYGAILRDGGVQFVVFSRSATAMRVLLYDDVEDPDPADAIPLDPKADRWGDVWSVFVPGIGAGQLYHYQADGPHDPQHGLRFDPQARLIDPYAKALAGDFLPPTDGILRPPKCVVVDDWFDWEHDRHLKRDLPDTVIYEMHVRGFTRAGSSGAEFPGTYLGVIEKIPYLKELGVTAVELMPVHEFPINNILGRREKRSNYWGYDPLAFFAPHRGYAADTKPGAQVQEFKQMVCALHEAGIEVILDVVFNHTAEGNHLGPTLSFKGLENSVYYMLDEQGNYKNYTGCGNTVNGNHPVVREMIFHCLRHWVHNYHVDGFRFDLASILNRDRKGNLVPNPPVVEAIAEDPMLADTKIIAEAWDAAGAYQVGSFANLRWSEWNGRFRDDVRRYWRGDPGTVAAFATRLAGSSDLYQSSGRSPYHSINFITSHDGFTLNDLLSYEHKHNEDNSENNQDGETVNHSMNYGVEGPTRRRDIVRLRTRHAKSLLSTLLLSLGVPMVLSGDEVLRTQRGNNNAYCQDNPISWFDWKLVEKNADFLRFVRCLIRFRLSQPVLRRRRFLSGQPSHPGALPDVAWFDSMGVEKNWNSHGDALICLFGAQPGDARPGEPAHHVMLFANPAPNAVVFQVPALCQPLTWHTAIDTAADGPGDIFPDLNGPLLDSAQPIEVASRALMCFTSPLASTNGQHSSSGPTEPPSAGPQPPAAGTNGR